MDQASARDEGRKSKSVTAGEVRRAESVDSQYDCREEEGKSGTVSVEGTGNQKGKG